MQDQHLLADAILELAPQPTCRSLNVFEVAELLLQWRRVVVMLEPLDLLLDRVLDYVVVSVGVLAKHFVDHIHVVFHVVEEGFPG